MRTNKSKENVLAYGEVTGHSHKVDVDVFDTDDPKVKEFDGATVVHHEEHKPIILPNKEWASSQVNEMDHLSGMVNPVQD